jgi:hypothetical protein
LDSFLHEVAQNFEVFSNEIKKSNVKQIGDEIMRKKSTPLFDFCNLFLKE